MDGFSRQLLCLVDKRSIKNKPSSFGVYLGDFEVPPTPAQARLLTQWDLLIVDPNRLGAKDAIAGTKGPCFLGRLDLDAVLSEDGSALLAVQQTAHTIARTFQRSAFTGVLLAGWEGKFSPAVLREILKAIDGVGLAVYLEACPPEFLKDSKVLRSAHVAGLVVRNASILPNGEPKLSAPTAA